MCFEPSQPQRITSGLNILRTEDDKTMDRGRYYREHAVPLQGETQGDEAGHA